MKIKKIRMLIANPILKEKIEKKNSFLKKDKKTRVNFAWLAKSITQVSRPV
jgi:hypothetical protein